MSAKNLSQLRTQVSQIDTEILILLERRMQLAVKIGRRKKQMGKPIFDEQREVLLLLDLKKQLANTDLPVEKTLEIWGKILEISRDMQC